MATNRERLDGLEGSMLEVKESIDRLYALHAQKQEKKSGRRNRQPKLSSSSSEEKRSHSESSDSSSAASVHSRCSSRHTETGRKTSHKTSVRMDFPRFFGEEPHVWLDRAKQYFLLHNIHGSEKVSIASFYLEGDANQWWQWFSKSNRDQRLKWKKFEKGLLRFGQGSYEDPNESICKLRQTGTFKEFLSEFERLMNCLPNWSRQALQGAFMAGLREEIAGEIRLFNPKDLQSAIELAKRKDEQLQGIRKSAPRTNQRLTPFTTPPSPQNKESSSAPKRMTWEEMRQCREKNLCFNCDERFTPGHRCKNKGIMMIEFEGQLMENYDDESASHIDDPQISINALAGETGGQAMRLQGKIEQHVVHILVDSGSSLNFINTSIACRLRLPLTKCEPITIKVANGERLKCSGKYDHVRIVVQGCSFSVTLFALPLPGLDVVLGIPWLEELGPVVVDYGKLTMQFQREDRECLLHGIPRKIAESTGLNEIVNEWQHGAQLFGIMMTKIIPEEHKCDQVDEAEVLKLLEEFEDVMKPTQKLPPSREFDHKIRLVDETQAVNVAPYRYAHFQKNEKLKDKSMRC